jgi:hypothetical protein
MDPYLESPVYWPDFHLRFINYWCEAIADLLPPNYEARMDELVIEEESRESFIKIVQLPQRTLVAVLELLSPSNKEGAGRIEYLAKRNALLLQDVHLVELDLLLGGRRLPLREPLPPADYFALVSRGDRRPDCNVYAWQLPDLLPTIPVPLRSPGRDVPANLAKVFNLAYDRGRYANSLNYDEAPTVVFGREQTAWVRSRVKSGP